MNFTLKTSKNREPRIILVKRLSISIISSIILTITYFIINIIVDKQIGTTHPLNINIVFGAAVVYLTLFVSIIPTTWLSTWAFRVLENQRGKEVIYSSTYSLLIMVFFMFIIPYLFPSSEHQTAPIKIEKNVILFDGEITEDTAKILSEILINTSLSTNETKHIILVLNSKGGLISGMSHILETIESIHDKVFFETRVLDEGLCASACVPIWLSGAERGMGKNSALMIHEQSTLMKSEYNTLNVVHNTLMLFINRVNLGINGSILKDEFSKKWKSVFNFTKKEGVWNWVSRKNCWLTARQVNTLFQDLNVIIDPREPSEETVQRHCYWEDPRQPEGDRGRP